MTRLVVLMLFLCIIIVTSLFGGHFGYEVNGVPKGGEIEGQPGLLGAIEWGWNAMEFLIDMTGFQIDGVPEEMSAGFLFIVVISAIIIVSFFLPGGGG